jgi:hypothetical protein
MIVARNSNHSCKMNRTSLKFLSPVIIVFILLNAFLLTSRNWLLNKGVDQEVLIVGNLVLFIISLFAFVFTYRSLQSSNHHAFVRAMYGSFIVKLFAVAIAAFIYIKLAGQALNKPALYICMVLYLVYTFLEVNALLRVLKQKKNA